MYSVPWKPSWALFKAQESSNIVWVFVTINTYTFRLKRRASLKLVVVRLLKCHTKGSFGVPTGLLPRLVALLSPVLHGLTWIGAEQARLDRQLAVSGFKLSRFFLAKSGEPKPLALPHRLRSEARGAGQGK